jgi:SAM-dependent methyltransferase
MDLKHIEAETLGHYQQSAEAFWEGTKDHNVKQNYDALLKYLPKDKALDILDFGCGPGRDVKYFHDLGHRVIGLDGCEQFCEMARKHSNCEIWHQSFFDLNLPAQAFDGIFANASLFHVPSEMLPQVLLQLHAALREGGVLFSSNPRGSGEGWSGKRYGHYIELEQSREYWQQAGFEIVEFYYRPEGLPLHQQPWLAMVSRKV